MKVKLTRVTENPVDAIEEAASNCYDSELTGGKIMNACYKSGHHSVLEFADFTFHVEGVSRALLAQLSRHRFCSFAVRSQRYCDENNFKYVVPHSFEHNHDAMLEYVRTMEKILETYKYLQTIGIPNEDARYVLPNACETILEIKMNGRELIHVYNERGCIRAQWEIRELVQLMKAAIEAEGGEAAEFAKFLVPGCERFGKDYAFCPEHSSCGRHPRLKDLRFDKIK
jgi:thymidylate synthase (FAD)